MIRFTIRELVLATVIAGMGLAWWLDYRKSTSRGTNLYRHAQRLHRSLMQAKCANTDLELLTLEYAKKAQRKLDLDLQLLKQGRDPRDIPYRITADSAVDWAVLKEDIPQP